MVDLLQHLNPQQRAAVSLPAEPALVLAGAGSGKTRVLTTRIAWLIQSGQISPAGVMAVTFTNKSAKEMLARLTAQLPINTRGMWVGTFHGLCNRMLRAHHREAALPALFQILDMADQLAAIKRLLKTLNVDPEHYPPRELQHFINACKDAGERPHALEARDENRRTQIDLYREYEAQCQREGVVDFAELLLRSYELLERVEPLRSHYQTRFRHILVDEFQDTNRLQYRWLKLLAGPPGAGGASLFCVGDDDQSIYGFRGAEVANLRDFEREYHVTHLVRLEQNYRSHGNILDAANAIIDHNRDRLGKSLWTEQGEGELIRIYEAVSDEDEARFIVEEIQALVHDGALRADIALLYRSNAQSRVLEHFLFSAGIPYRVYGGLRFFERQEIKHALAYLRLIANPNDDTAFARVVNFPTRGIGARSLEVLAETAAAAQRSLYASVSLLSGKPAAVLGNFVALIEHMREATQGRELPELVDQVLDLCGLRAHYNAEREGRERLENLDELLNAAANFMAEGSGLDPAETNPSGNSGSLANFLAHASLEAGDHQAEQGKDAVQLMTVHAAKGLEFDVVFVTGLEEDLFPHQNSVLDPRGLEEERRLMYVAITRARERLYLCHAQTRLLHGQTRYSVRSRFLDEIPPVLTRSLSPKRAVRTASVWGGGFAARTVASPAPKIRVSARVPDLGGLRIGQNVRHARFGVGVILAAEGSGSDARVQVNFGADGVKWLMLAMAGLEPA